MEGPSFVQMVRTAMFTTVATVMALAIVATAVKKTMIL